MGSGKIVEMSMGVVDIVVGTNDDFRTVFCDRREQKIRIFDQIERF
tara:strand:- start:402 stop:539 length:138 start_codon:yes stop_codon:yes gene_type:complete